jgi:hypothetical protein
VYSVSNHTSPIATYVLPGGRCSSGLIADNCLFLGGFDRNISVYEISTSLTEPLKPFAIIETSYHICKIIKVGQELVLAGDTAIISIFDIKNFKITQT